MTYAVSMTLPFARCNTRKRKGVCGRMYVFPCYKTNLIKTTLFSLQNLFSTLYSLCLFSCDESPHKYRRADARRAKCAEGKFHFEHRLGKLNNAERRTSLLYPNRINDSNKKEHIALMATTYFMILSMRQATATRRQPEAHISRIKSNQLCMHSIK